MNANLAAIAADYRSGLGTYLVGGGEPALKRAYELGRTALKGEVGLLELISLHHEALAAWIGESSTPAETARHLKAAEDFVAEAISPFEMTHRGFREANSALHRMNERLEDEAKRIAHTLHDDTGALLVTVHLAFKELERDVPPAAREQFTRVRLQLKELEEHLRHLSHELRPTILDDLGLAPALRFLAEGISTRSGLQVEVEDRLHRWLPPNIQTALYRIVQEALTNVVRHAHATHVVVRIEGDEHVIRCVVADDGVGMSARPATSPERGHGLGLLGIRERVAALDGSLRITSSPQGTQLLISIPWRESS